MVSILRTEGLVKSFGRFHAVRGVDLQVAEGDLFGFLGLNGAGKTTTIRMCLGLVRPTSGRVELFGKDLQSNFIEAMSRTGALVELPAYYPHLTAAQNLEIVRLLTPGIPAARIAEVLEKVGIASRMHDPVRGFSQGMRQRLGIAMALLPNPRLVILDEPTNGLDPAGINHIRSTIQELNRRDGVTFLISSHLLHEIEITCNRVAIIREGKIVVQDRVDTLLSKAAGVVRIEADPRDRAKELMSKLGWVTSVADQAGGAMEVRVDPSRFAELNAELHKAGLRVPAFAPRRVSLEEYFLEQQA